MVLTKAAARLSPARCHTFVIEMMIALGVVVQSTLGLQQLLGRLKERLDNTGGVLKSGQIQELTEQVPLPCDSASANAM